MDEIEWFGGSDPTRMLVFFRNRASDRKLRYFACACCERIAHLFSGDSDLEAIGTVERFADGQGTQTELAALHIRMTMAALFEATGEDAAGTAASTSTVCAAVLAEQHADVNHPKGQGDYFAAESGERKAQSRLLCDIFGSPFRPVTFDPAWRTSTAVAVAQQMYDSRDFSAMPILADALQDAGCEDKQVLLHCRGGGPHVRGCWVVDQVLRMQ